MGTRSVTEVRSKWDGEPEYKTHARIFRHWDGYPECHGRYLLFFMEGRSIVNGKTGKETPPYCNGPGRFAGQLVASLLSDDHEPDILNHDGDCGQDYTYRIDIDFGMRGGVISRISVNNFGEDIFSGNLPEYKGWIQKLEEEG